MQNMRLDALNFFKSYTHTFFDKLEVATNNDILLNDIEVGSYYTGVTIVNEFYSRFEYYACGTGLALPRFNIALAEHGGF